MKTTPVLSASTKSPGDTRTEERSYAELEYPSAPILPSPGPPTLMWGTYMGNEKRDKPHEDAFLLPHLVIGVLWDLEIWRRTAAGRHWIQRISDESPVRAYETVPSIPQQQRVAAHPAAKPLAKARRRLQKHVTAKNAKKTTKSKARPRSA